MLTDIMFGGEPKGLAIALKCVAEGKPCVIVTHTHTTYGHLYYPWVGKAMSYLEKLGVPVILITRPENPKPWRTASHKLFELISAKLLAENSEQGASWRHYCEDVLNESIEN